jgi:hypothetical protein
MQIRAYECSIKDTNRSTIVFASSPSKAKVSFWYDIRDYWDVKYTDLRCRCVGNPITPSSFERTAIKRDVPFAKIGMKVELDGKTGYIVGNNNDANFDVEFENGSVFNCHPNWKMKYFDDSGQLIKEF